MQLPAIRGRDTLNNVEQVTQDAPPAGNYIIRVKGSRIATSSQSYFIAYGADTLNRFEWMYPMARDPVEAGTGVLLRWNAIFTAGTTGQLQYSFDGSAWQTIASNIDVSKPYIRWNAPDTFSTALLRMVVGSSTYTTDTFVLSKLINTRVGFNCADSFLFYWNRPKGVNSFQVYKLGSKFLEPVTITTDTFYLAAKSTAGSRHFTIAPIIKSREGIKAYTFDYTSQGVECYFKSFLAQLNASQASLLLELGVIYHVKKIIVQKLSGNAYRDIQTITDPTALQFSFNDAALQQGVNAYRIALQLADGRMIYSSTEVVYYLGNTDYVVYPNPVRAGSGLRILQKEAADLRVMIYDATGRLVKDESYADVVNPINIAGLQKGLYIISIVKEGAKVFRGKMIVQ